MEAGGMVLLLSAVTAWGPVVGISSASEALYPEIFNIAPDSDVTANATCGARRSEEYCELSSIVYMTGEDCQICDSYSSEPGRRHPISNIVDGSDAWWQGPTLEQDMDNQWVTIQMDLRQEFEVAYVILKTAVSPAPGTWVLERSLDGDIYQPWQYFASSDAACRSHFGVEPTRGKPKYRADTDVICTSYFSKLNPLMKAEIYVPLITGRPSSERPSAELLQFVRARHIRVRLQGVLRLNSHQLAFSGGRAEPEVLRSYFYSLREITVGGRCVCNGHASSCPAQRFTRLPHQCECEHNTCGANCDTCCPLYNQRPWSPGGAYSAGCEQCQCFGHAEECYFDTDVARDKKSLNLAGERKGGGVCAGCKDFTTGINCESCLPGYYRPAGVRPDAPQPCRRCRCDAAGATGECVPDDTLLSEGQVPGACVCREGFAGEQCERCAHGYRNYPSCERCPCDQAGTLTAECDGESCTCKAHVQGRRCDTCRPGYFNLQADNPEGCTECFCFGLTSICTSSYLGVENVTTIVPWTVTSLDGSVEVEPYMDGTTQLVANDEMSDRSGYYWRAPEELLGLQIYSYGQAMQFRTSWVVRRGDTAGRPIKGPDIIIEGGGLRLGYGINMHTGDSATITAPLVERHWFRMAKRVNNIVRKRRGRYVRGPVSRRQLMRVLGSLKRLLVRAKYHSDQIEGGLHDFVLKIGSETSVSTERTTTVEQCQCPPGYAGRSCEKCDFGFRRLDGTLYRGECVPCDCNGHSADCDPSTGQCGTCLHNTAGDNCELCADGYYGNALLGTPDACKPCACPEEVEKGDPTPSCVSDPAGEDYICTSCPPGHEGLHCERCGPGHYGSPLTPGGGCRPCQCNGNVDAADAAACDSVTGECLSCRGHTGGWHCDVCEDGYHGDATAQDCRPCECSMFGSESPLCDHVTGQCACKERFVGKRCGRCQNAGGNIEADCLECFCDLSGSLGPLCDPESGQCQCRSGVQGVNCSTCMENHFGFGNEAGCIGCQCHQVGSTSQKCDIITGACSCRPHVTGRSCDRCQPGYFGLESGGGCRRCDCDPVGALRDSCDPVTGRCRCKPGVGGERCSSCLPGYFRLGDTGCQECEACNLPGHLCDPYTGECICPPNTEGANCESCARGHWGWNNLSGCRPCDCSIQGSLSSECDVLTGQCNCFNGLGGLKCDECESGFYDFPLCQPCRCNVAGSTSCDSGGLCPCDDRGRCQCRDNVEGAKCDRCVEGTIGLSEDNPDGCTPCFCFTRSRQCSQAEFSWVPAVIETTRTVSFEYDETSESFQTLPVVPWNTQEICYIHLTLPDSRAVTLRQGQTRLNVTNTLRVVPGFSGDVTLGLNFPFDAPIYWQLPPKLLGDKVRSYNGHLRFRTASFGGSRPFPASILSSYPLVQLQGNFRLVLEHFPLTSQADGNHEVKLHESFWRVKGGQPGSVTREMLMVALQNTQHVLIRATNLLDATKVTLSDVSWDIAEPTYAREGAPALGIERCACPVGYNGSSCQDPSIGFFRSFTPGYSNSEIIIELVGESVPCQCNGRADVCDPDTGSCQNCTENTTGNSCESCAAGYYGNPAEGPCLPCLCPTVQSSNARSCVSNYRGGFRCECEAGYTGERCDRCAYGFYGSALDTSAGCTPCGCDSTGSLTPDCDRDSGQCRCRPGVTGRDCTTCKDRHVLTGRGCQECRDGCVEVLFSAVDELSVIASSINISGASVAPWRTLYEFGNATEEWEERRDEYRDTQMALTNMRDTLDLTRFANIILVTVEELLQKLPSENNEARDLRNEIDEIYQSVMATKFEAEETVAGLLNYAIGETPSVAIELTLAEAESILSELRRRDLGPPQQRAEEALEEARRLLERLRGMTAGSGGLDEVRERLDALRERLEDARRLLADEVQEPVVQVTLLLHELQKQLASLNSSRMELQHQADVCDALLKGSAELQDRTRTLYDSGRNDVIDLGDLTFQLGLSKDSLLRRTSVLDSLTDDFRVKTIIPAEVHASKLMAQAERLVGLFQATRQEADLSLQAAEAYQKIVDALNSAREAASDASEAAENAYEQAYPRDTDSLVSLGTQTKTRSQALLDRANALAKQVSELSAKMDASAARLRGVNETLQEAAGVNQGVRAALDRIDLTALAKGTLAAMDVSRAAMSTSEEVQRRVQAVLEDVDTRLRPGIKDLDAGGRENLGNVTDSVREAKKDITRANIKAMEAEEKLEGLRELDDTLNLKLQNLRNKILKARQAASNIRVSLKGPSLGCSRTYKAPALQASTASSIRLNYAIDEPATRDALLLYLPSQTQRDFMAVEMVDRHVRFLWNNGGQTQMVEHPLELHTSNEQLIDEQKWYIINAQRIGSLGRLNVQPFRGSVVAPVSNATSDGLSILELSSSDTVYVGALPENADKTILSNRFAGCMYEAAVNGQPLGLWNFATNRGCGACRAGPSSDEASSSPGYSFNGAGYAELPALRPGSTIPMLYSVLLSVQTFDQNALLFLAVNREKEQFFSVELSDGHVVARVGFSRKEEDILVVTSNGRYNTGERTWIETTRAASDVGLKINNGEESQKAVPSPGSRHRQLDLDLEGSRLYFGGVPPDLDRSGWSAVSFVPLLGCVDDLQVGQTTQNPLVGNSTGVTRGCGGQLLKTAGFHGNGYMEFKSKRLKKKATFGFTFKTTRPEGLLLISTYTGKNDSVEDDNDYDEPMKSRQLLPGSVPANSPLLSEYYSVQLIGGRLQLAVNGGAGEVLLASKKFYNDGELYTVTVLKERRRIQLRVDDIQVATGQLQKGSSSVDAPEQDGLYIGGLPPDVRPAHMATIPPGFEGCVSDVIFGDSLLQFDSPVRHKHVAIGRCNGDLLRGQMLHEMATSPDPTTCNKPSLVTREDRAVKLGDMPYSHVYVPVRKRKLKGDFNITLDFRTFYPNGLLLHSEGNSRRSSSYLSLSLRNGAVQLEVKRGRRSLRLAAGQQLNDGEWKMVTLVRTKRKYFLLVPDASPASKRGPRSFRAGRALYIGGLPEAGVENRRQDPDSRIPGQKRLEMLRTEGFKGCIKQLSISGRVIDLPSGRNIMHRVGQCKARVELGSYFAGDAFATYDDSLRLGDMFDLRLDFRTSKLSGVLISLAPTAGIAGSALSLEIADGEVIFSVYNGGTQPIRARQKFPTKYIACNNQWHTVKANYVKNQATLKVDKYPERYGFSGNSAPWSLEGTQALYIGGLPASASNPILLQLDNFKGCIRNIMINGDRRDWTDMAALSNVLLNSCPVQR